MSAFVSLLLALVASIIAPTAPPLLPAEEAAVRLGMVHTGDAVSTVRRIPIVIVPHHLVASESIGAVFDRLRGRDVRRVIVLSPDHYNRCPTILCIVPASFPTTHGVVRPDLPSLAQLRSSPLVSSGPTLAEREHGIRFVAPFIREALPDARVVPMVVQQSRSWEPVREEIAALIASVSDERTLLVLSSDASHTLPLTEANAEDTKTLSSLLSFDLEAIRTLTTPEQTDCPACLWLAARRARDLSALLPTIVRHTNSATLLADPAAPDTTSHLAITFTVSDAPEPSDVAVGGDVTVARGVPPSELPLPLRSFWEGARIRVVNLEGPVRAPCLRATEGYRFCNDASTLKSLLSLATHWGVVNNHAADLGDADTQETVRQLGLLGVQTVTSTLREEGNVRLLAVSSVMNPVAGAPDVAAQTQTALASLGGDPQPSKLTIVLLHAGTEFDPELPASDSETARRFIDAGADAVIVGHSHVLGDTEFYREGVIVRGIGNLRFDQYAEQATRTVRLVRLRKTPDGQLRIATDVRALDRR